MSLGTHIKNLRQSQGLTQAQLAEKSGLNRNSIYKYENDMAMPRKPQIAAVAKALQVSVDYLMAGSGSENEFTRTLGLIGSKNPGDGKQTPALTDEDERSKQVREEIRSLLAEDFDKSALSRQLRTVEEAFLKARREMAALTQRILDLEKQETLEGVKSELSDIKKEQEKLIKDFNSQSITVNLSMGDQEPISVAIPLSKLNLESDNFDITESISDILSDALVETWQNNPDKIPDYIRKHANPESEKNKQGPKK